MRSKNLRVSTLVDDEWIEVESKAKPIAWEVEVEGKGTGVLVDASGHGDGVVVGDYTAKDLALIWESWRRGGTNQTQYQGVPDARRRVVAEELWSEDGRHALVVEGTLFNGVDGPRLRSILNGLAEELAPTDPTWWD